MKLKITLKPKVYSLWSRAETANYCNLSVKCNWVIALPLNKASTSVFRSILSGKLLFFTRPKYFRGIIDSKVLLKCTKIVQIISSHRSGQDSVTFN